MRIIGGTLKGRRIALPKEEGIRPTADRVREAVFSTLHSMTEIKNSLVLDLFAGTGALGIEAISRGAGYAYFVEKQEKAAARIQDTLEDFNIAERGKVLARDVQNVLEEPRRFFDIESTFDIIFADPPYGAFSAVRLIDLLCASALLSKESMLVFEGSSGLELEISKKDPLPLSPHLEKERSYGGTVVSYLMFK